MGDLLNCHNLHIMAHRSLVRLSLGVSISQHIHCISIMQVIGQGNVQLHHTSLCSNNTRGIKRIFATIPIVALSVPRVKVLAVVAREDGELVADVIELPVSCELEHKVREGGGR